MEVTTDIKFEQLLNTIKKLPAAKIKQLKSALDDGYIDAKASEELSDFQNYLLNGPVINAELPDESLSEAAIMKEVSAVRYDEDS